MTYCVGLYLKEGLVLLSDTRTNAGVDNISTFSKMHVFAQPGERLMVLLTAGNLATGSGFFVMGLLKKTLLANPLATVVGPGFADPAEQGPRVSFGALLGRGREQGRGVDGARRDRVDPDAERAHLPGQRLGESDHAALGRGVRGGRPDGSVLARRGSEGDDGPGSPEAPASRSKREQCQ